MEDKGIVGLAYWHNGMKQMSANRALHAPADARGLSFRIQASGVLEAQFAQLGAKAVPMPFAEAFAALQSGKVQGTENTWSNLYSQKLNTVQPFITETNHGVLDYMLVTNSRTWYAIPHKTRTELEAIIDEVTFAVNHAAEQQNQADRQRIQSSGRPSWCPSAPRNARPGAPPCSRCGSSSPRNRRRHRQGRADRQPQAVAVTRLRPGPAPRRPAPSHSWPG